VSNQIDKLRTALLGRYVIEQEIGSGGMATVYLAEDLKHDRKVAVKVLDPEFTSMLGAKRFFQEIEIAAKLNHPHILTLIDSGDAQGLLYYVMPYVPQQSLQERLDRVGRLPFDEAIRIVQHVGSALDYAHRQGVVHRDMKPGNVLLHEGVAMVADFGIALAASDAGGARITGRGFAMGTPEYMSPEQAAGRATDVRTDVYSLGCVLYEMLTGQPPFTGDNAQAVFAKRLTDPVPSAREQRRDIPVELDATLRRALARAPEDRFDAMVDFVDAVTAASSARPWVSSSSRRIPLVGFPRVAWLVLVGVSLVAGAALLAYARRGPNEPTGDAAALVELARTVEPRPSLAVLGFKNLSGRDDVAWLSTALSEMLTTELAAGRALRAVPGEVVSRMKVELALSDAESFGRETLSAIRSNIGSDMVVLGSYGAVGDTANPQMRLDIRLQSTVSGETVASVAEAGPAAELFDLVARAGTRLRDALGLGGMVVGGENVPRPARTTTTDALRWYAQGLEELRRFNATGARELLEAGIAADPGYAPAHAALSAAWSQLGYDQRALAEAKLAYELSEGVPEPERLLIEARYREVGREMDRAIAIYRSLWEAHPDNVDYGLGLAAAQRIAGSRRDAMSTIEALKQLPAPLSNDARIDLAECHIAELLSEYEREQAACAEARIKATAQGALLLVARSWFLEGRSWFFLNDADKSLAAFDEARRLYERTGHRSEVANVLNAVSIVTRTLGDRDRALAAAEEALAIKRDIGEQAGIALALNSLGIVVQQQGGLDRAAAIYQESVDLNRDIGNLPNVPSGLINLANVLSRLGKLERTRELYREAASMAEQTDNTYTQALALNNLRVVEFDLGNLTAARQAGEAAMQRFSDIGHQLMLGYTTYGMGLLFRAQDDLAAARRWLDSSLALREELELQTAQETRRALGMVLLDREEYAAAEAWIRETQTAFAGKLAPVDAGLLEALLAQALAGQGRLDDAGLAAERATALVEDSPDIKNGSLVKILAGEVTADVAGLRRVLATVEQAGYVPLQFEARLALGRVELEFGDAATGRAMLAVLARNASDRGFRRIARRASEALARR
jgi:tetratricopeptide (TPR) repeat protein/TolB-like protein